MPKDSVRDPLMTGRSGIAIAVNNQIIDQRPNKGLKNSTPVTLKTNNSSRVIERMARQPI